MIVNRRLLVVTWNWLGVVLLPATAGGRRAIQLASVLRSIEQSEAQPSKPEWEPHKPSQADHKEAPDSE